ncbi:MAG: efflux RND transporter periplasmic adaptor subunit [Candidatus Latescibacteria bacterium]|nr:efflux RND transporter periplasmic adaptor subunit [bacterium]MBD3424037.1 efflux RND transporter periplasmic adaptor subunit [Candidatus Latescibacterota bacterium]
MYFNNNNSFLPLAEKKAPPVRLLKEQFPIFLIISFLLLPGCSADQDDSSEEAGAAPAPAVEAVRAVRGSLPLTERLTGVVKAKNQVAIYPEISAPITEVLIRDGEYVEKDQPLVRLRDNQLRKQLKQTRASYQIAVAQARQAEARLKEIRAELTRTRSLAKKGLTSPAELEAVETRAISAEADLELAKARIEEAEANVEEREEALSQTVIRAPVSGFIGTRDAEVGMLVNGNTRLFTLGQLQEIEVEIVLTDRMLKYIEAGQRVEIFPGSEVSDPIEGKVSRISPFLNQVTHSTEAEIDLPNPGRKLNPGMFVTVDIFYGESENATLVPLSALYENPSTGITGVYVAQDSIRQEAASDTTDISNITLTEPVSFKFTRVRVMARGRMDAGLEGIDPGAWVISLGQDLIDGESGMARVNAVGREWVYRLQSLQRQDLLEEIMRQHREAARDFTPGKSESSQAR